MAEVNKLNDKAMAENLVVENPPYSFRHTFEEILTRLAAAYKVHACDIVERLELCLYLRGRFLRGHILVNVGKDLILISDVLNYLVDVYIQEA